MFVTYKSQGPKKAGGKLTDDPSPFVQRWLSDDQLGCRGGRGKGGREVKASLVGGEVWIHRE